MDANNVSPLSPEPFDNHEGGQVADGFYGNVAGGPDHQPQVADGISPAVLTSTTLTLQHRAFTAADELARQVAIPGPQERMSPLAEAVERLGQHVTDLHFTLESTRDIHTNVQTFIHQHLTSCDMAMGRLGKQLLRVGPPETLEDVNWEFVVCYTDLLLRYCDLFAYVEEALRLEDPAGQDRGIRVEGARRLIEALNRPMESCMATNSILLSGGIEPRAIENQAEAEDFGEQSAKAAKAAEAQGQHAEEGEAPPPPYEPAFEATSSSTPNDSTFDAGPPLPMRTTRTSSSGPSSRMSLPPPFESSRSLTDFDPMRRGKQKAPAPAPAQMPNGNKENSFSSITRSFKALTAGLWAKPDPLVSALCQAVTHGDTQQVSGLIKHGANINGRNEDGDSPLQCAINADQGEAASVLIEAGAEYSGSGGSKTPALFTAASAGSVSVCRVIAGKGSRVDQRNISGQPYFVDVVASGNLAGIQFLLERGANPNLSSINGRPIVAMAVKKNNMELVRLLIRHGAQLNVTDMTGNSLLAMALEKCDDKVIQLLLDNGADVNSRTMTGISVLTSAVTRGRPDLALDLIRRGADPNARDLMAQPLIIVAIKDTKALAAERLQLIRALLDHGASANAADNIWGMPCLWLAVERGHDQEVVEILLQHGADMSTTNRDDMTLLVYAIDKMDLELAELLLKKGADANLADGRGRTPLLAALVKHDADMVSLLVRYGADVARARRDAPAEVAKVFERAEVREALAGRAPGEMWPRMRGPSGTQGTLR